MNASEQLAARLHRLRPWLDRCRRPDGLRQECFEHGPRGNAYLAMDIRSDARAASFNENRVYLCGAQGGLQPEGIGHFIRRFQDQGVARFFVWLSPGPRLAEVEGWLEDAGLERVTWSRYLTLALAGPDRPPRPGRLVVREVGSAEIRQARGELGEAVWDDYVATAAQPGFHHFMAYAADGRPVATALLAHREGLGYLSYAITVPEFRGQGAQQALIAARVALARRLGCTQVCSETLSQLPHSLSNLEQLGFEVVHEKGVYAWEA